MYKIIQAIQASEFLQIVRPTDDDDDDDDNAPCAVLSNPQGIPNRHFWPRLAADANAFLARVTQDKRGAYYTPASFHPEPNGTRKRGKHLVKAVKALWMDIEGSEAKGGYEGGKAVLTALRGFIEATKLAPTAIVLTGSGGLHAYYVMNQALPLRAWESYASALVRLTEKHGLRIDKPVTTDPSRIMRVPGSIHHKTGRTVEAYRTGGTYGVAELGELIGALDPLGEALAARDAKCIKAHIRFSLRETAKHCAALRKAIEKMGASTPYQPWLLALQMAKLSVEGEEFAHEISRGHEDYDPGEVERKLASLTGGPPSCETWHAAWGNQSPCLGCLYGGLK